MKGRCTYSASGTTLFRSDSRRFIFSTCPVLTYERRAAVLKACSSLCITGPCSSGKTLVLLHTLVDVISPYGMGETAVYLDLDLSFDIEVFRHILRKQIKSKTDSSVLLDQEVEETMTRLVYLPVYNIEDLPSLLVALDPYFQSNHTRFLAIDSIISQYGKGENRELGTTCINLLEWLCYKHGLAMIYTKRVGTGYTVPFQVSTIYHEEMPEDTIDTELCIGNVDIVNNILTFGLPADWIPESSNRDTSVPVELPAVETARANTAGYETYGNLSNTKTKPLAPNSARTAIQEKEFAICSGVTLCLLPCKRGSHESSGYIGCILKGIGNERDWYSDLSLFSGRKSPYSLCRPRRMYYLSSLIEESEAEETSNEEEETSAADYTQTQDLVMSVPLSNEMETRAPETAVTTDSVPVVSSSSRSDSTAVNPEMLATLRFALFRVNKDRSLMEQIFTLHR